MDISDDPNILPYATPASSHSLPWWMVVSATFFYLAATGTAALIVSKTLSDDLVINGIMLILLLSACVIERNALRESGTWHSAVSLVLVSVLGVLIPFSVIGMTVVMHTKGPYSAIEVRLILLGISIAIIGAFVAISHLRWWAREKAPSTLQVMPPSA